MKIGRLFMAVIWRKVRFRSLVARVVLALRLRIILTRLSMNLTGIMIVSAVLDFVNRLRRLPTLGLSYGIRGGLDWDRQMSL